MRIVINDNFEGFYLQSFRKSVLSLEMSIPKLCRLLQKTPST